MKNLKKLMLSAETVRVLSDADAARVQGGRPYPSAVLCIWLTQGCPPPLTVTGCPDTQWQCV